MIRPTMSHALNKDDLHKLMSDYATSLEEQLAKANERVTELEINIKSQLPAYKTIREAFMDGVFWYEQSNKVNQIELDKAAHKYANHEIERQQLRKEQGE